MRVVAITTGGPGSYSRVFGDLVAGGLREAGADVTRIDLSEDVRDLPGHDAYLGVGDELLWRNPPIVAAIRGMGGRCADFRARYMNPRPTYLYRRFTDHRGRGPDMVFTHFRSRHPRSHYVGQCVDAAELFPEHDGRFTVFIDHDRPRRSVLADILAQCAALHRERPEWRFWFMSDRGIVENDFRMPEAAHRTYPFTEIAWYYRRTHVVLPTHRETQGMLAAEIAMCGGLTVLRPWMYPAERRAEIPHLLYRRRLTLPETVDIEANRRVALGNFSPAAFAARVMAGLERLVRLPRR
ncbi:MAG: hypothetical protein JKP98_16700 [Rhodobacteraceae bacterium]|jgi:hypothetical protein|nr:hypothetical protein [Paracoccaceae bacterium]MBL4558129.1 hypothetical protein [Paracoccaceae bacterium]